MGLEQTIKTGVDTAFNAAGDQVRTIALSPPGTFVYNDALDSYARTPAADVPATAIRYEGVTMIDGVEQHSAIYLVRTSELVGFDPITTAWKLSDTADADVEKRDIAKIGRPHTTILLLYVVSKDETTT